MSDADISNKTKTIKAFASPQRRGILLLGMHRSGTSACTRVLNLLGCALPERLLGPAAGNEAGHWESVDVVHLNDKILSSAGSSWEDWGPINDDWGGSAIRAQMIETARALVKDHCQLGPLFAIKDPRICRLADIWVEAMRGEEVEPLVLVMLRNPAEVSASLEHRDLMTRGYGLLLWLRHVLDAELLSRGERRVFCRYDQLMGNWQGMIAKVKSELNVAFPRSSQSVYMEIDAFLSSDRRHHEEKQESVISNPGLSEWLRRTYAIMLMWSEEGEDSKDHAELDRIREEFGRAYSTFARLLLSGDAAGRVGSGARLKQELTTKLAEAAQATEAARSAVSEAESLRTAAETRKTELQRELSELEGMLPELRAKTEIEHAARLETERLLTVAQDELGKRLDAETELTGKLATLESTLAQREEELAQLWIKMDEAVSGARAAEKCHEHEQDQRLAAEQMLGKHEITIAAQQAEISALVARAQDNEQGMRDAQREKERVEERLAVRFQEIAQLTTILRDEALRAERVEENVFWIQQMEQVRESFPWWWALMPQDWRRQREHRCYRRAGLFDAQKYLDTYPDVALDGMDPIRHYVLHGMSEGRVKEQ